MSIILETSKSDSIEGRNLGADNRLWNCESVHSPLKHNTVTAFVGYYFTALGIGTCRAVARGLSGKIPVV